MAGLKTRETGASVDAFLDRVSNDKRRRDALVVKDMMARVTGCAPKMWGSSLVGFGSYRYKYASGRENKFFITGFSPRKQALTIYIMPGFGQYEALMARLGKYKTGKSCLYVNNLEDVDLPTLEQLIRLSVQFMLEKYGD